MDDSPPVTAEMWIERQQVIGDAIQRWTERPAPENAISQAAIKPERKTRRIIYYDGRFYNEQEVLDALSRHFRMTSWADIIVMSHAHVYGTATERAQHCLEVIVRDHSNGSALPGFVLATFLEIRRAS